MEVGIKMRQALVNVTALVCAVGFLMTVGSGRAFAEVVSCGQTVIHDTTLENDLTDCRGDGIVIGADNIVLDLNGHTIDGLDNPYSAAAGVNNRDGHDNVEVTNGTIQHFAAGFSDFGGDNNHAHALTIQQGFFGFEANGSHGTIVDHNRFLANDAPSVSIRFGSSDCVVAHNNVANSESALEGILVYGADDNRVVHNVATGGAAGIQLSATDRVIVEHNEVFDSQQGIVMGLEVHHNSIAHNFLHDNEYFGIRVEQSSANHVAWNDVERNHYAGIALDPVSGGGRSTGNLIEHNSLSGNGMGVYLAGSDENVFDANRVVSSDTDGMFVSSGSARNIFARNSSDGNGDDGIDTDNGSTSFTANHADRNGDLGIEAAPGVTDGGGNKASGNGNPLQCLYVACK